MDLGQISSFWCNSIALMWKKGRGNVGSSFSRENEEVVAGAGQDHTEKWDWRCFLGETSELRAG